MNLGASKTLGLAIFFCASTCSAQSQTCGEIEMTRPPGIGSAPRSSRAVAPTEVLREITDPHTGCRWLLVRDPNHLSGPGRLIATADSILDAHLETSMHPPLQVIHSGDHLTLEESTSTVEARLEAVALGPAMVGSPFNVRLVLGGKVMRARALGPGRAAFLFESGVRP